jgi:hypothetical protein
MHAVPKNPTETERGKDRDDKKYENIVVYTLKKEDAAQT